MEYNPLLPIQELQKWSPPAFSSEPSHDSPPPRLSVRSLFYDRHLGKNVCLRQVNSLPSLLTDICKSLDKVLDEILEVQDYLPAFANHDDFVHARSLPESPPPLPDANTVARFYQNTTARCCIAPVSTFLHPRMSRWYTVLAWQTNSLGDDNGEVMQDSYTLGISKRLLTNDPSRSRKDVLDTLTEPEKAHLRKMAERFESLATWIILPACNGSEELLTAMETEELTPRAFVCENYPVTGWSPATSKPPLSVDAATTTWSIPPLPSDDRMANCLPNRRRSPRSKVSSNPIQPIKTSGTVGVPDSKRMNSSLRKGIELDAFLQHAWRKSVEADTTVIVFHCGNLERIGIRHRERQTLYLSPLIDVPRSKDPVYGNLHINLYLAIFRDAEDRLSRLQALERQHTLSSRVSLSRKRKRRLDNDVSPEDLRQSKRHKPSSDPIHHVLPQADTSSSCHMSFKAIVDESLARDVLFLSFREGVFSSQAPAPFARDTQLAVDGISTRAVKPIQRSRMYTPQQYISLIITSRSIGEGAVGVVHRADLEITDRAGNTRTCDVVVKLAFSPQQQLKMRKEYAIYEHLVAAKVEGIPTVFGLFQDMTDGGPLALVMSYGGDNLWTARPSSNEEQVELSPEERDYVMEIVKSIHRSGVAHRDLRPDNILINDEGRITIIDFDRATLWPSRNVKHFERDYLRHLLNGKYIGELGSGSPRPYFDVVYSDTDPE